MKSLQRIFSLVPDCHTESHYGDLWRRHIYEGLRGVVKQLVLPEGLNFAWARPAWRESAETLLEKTRCSERLMDQIKAAHAAHPLDAVISHCYTHDLDLEVVRSVIRLGVPWINFFCDNIHSFAKVESLAGVVSLNWFPEMNAIPKYRRLKTAYLCKPYALNPAFLPDLRCRTPRYPVVFIGVPIPHRIQQLAALRIFGVTAEVRGPGWKSAGQSPFSNTKPKPWLPRLIGFCQSRPGEKVLSRLAWAVIRGQAGSELGQAEFEEFLQSSEIVLGLNQGRDETGAWQSYLKFRDLEFPGYGCAYLTEDNTDIREVFQVGKEILTYRDMRDAAGIIRALKRAPERMQAIAQAGRERVLLEHTWQVRCRQLAEALN